MSDRPKIYLEFEYSERVIVAVDREHLEDYAGTLDADDLAARAIEGGEGWAVGLVDEIASRRADPTDPSIGRALMDYDVEIEVHETWNTDTGYHPVEYGL